MNSLFFDNWNLHSGEQKAQKKAALIEIFVKGGSNKFEYFFPF
jgi:hypothetical protein